MGISSLGGAGDALCRRRIHILALTIIVVALALRVYHLEWSFSNNGIDEGVMAERVLMVSEGYDLYTELPCDQAPAAFLLGSVVWGDVVSLRALTVLFSLLAIGCCMVASHRIAGSRAMLITGALLAVDFTFLRESRLFSLDALAASMLAFSLLAFVLYLRDKKLVYLGASGLLVGISASMKLIGVVGVIGMLLFVALELRAKRSTVRNALRETSTVVVSSAIPMAALLLALGPSEMIDGMLFAQGHREFDAYLKLSIVVFFGLCVSYVLPLVRAKALWAAGAEERLLLCVTAAIVIFMLLQPLVFLHHMALASPALAILAGVAIDREIGRKRVVCNRSDVTIASKLVPSGRVAISLFIASIAVSGGLSVYGLAAQDEPIQAVYGSALSELTDVDDWVVSGDPLIAAYAERRVPPEVVNVAVRQYPELTFDVLTDAIVTYDVAVVVVCYHLNDFEGLPGFLHGHDYVMISPSIFRDGNDAVLDLFQEGIGPVSFFMRADLAVGLSLEYARPANSDGWLSLNSTILSPG